MTADEIIAAARDCVGTPFRHQGRLVGEGLDCVGVPLHVASVFGLETVVVGGYGRTPVEGQLEAALASQPCLMPVEIADRRPGDVLLMRLPREPSHVAINAGETIIHAYEATGKCVEHRLDERWQARIVRVYRFAGMA